MDDRCFEKIIKICEESLLNNFSYHNENVEISFCKDGRLPVEIQLKNGCNDGNNILPEKKVSVDIDVEQKENIDKIIENKEIIIKSCFVGLFSLSEKIVKGENKKVKKGEVLGMIEAMKIYNEVISPVDGEIEKILIDDGSLVECEQELILIKVE